MDIVKVGREVLGTIERGPACVAVGLANNFGVWQYSYSTPQQTGIVGLESLWIDPV